MKLSVLLERKRIQWLHVNHPARWVASAAHWKRLFSNVILWGQSNLKPPAMSVPKFIGTWSCGVVVTCPLSMSHRSARLPLYMNLSFWNINRCSSNKSVRFTAAAHFVLLSSRLKFAFSVTGPQEIFNQKIFVCFKYSFLVRFKYKPRVYLFFAEDFSIKSIRDAELPAYIVKSNRKSSHGVKGGIFSRVKLMKINKWQKIFATNFLKLIV